MDDVVVTKKLGPMVPSDRWTAVLSNKEVVYEDRLPNVPTAWERLAAYCDVNDLHIVGLSANVGGCEVVLPDEQDAYVQYKKVQSTGSWSAVSMCIGFVQEGQAKIYMFAPDHSSQSFITADPGAPKAIYRKVKHGGEKA